MLNKMLHSFVPRFVVVQSLGLSLMTGLYFLGVLTKPFTGNNAYLCVFIVLLGLYGIIEVYKQKWDSVKWVATHVVRVGLLGTVVGLIIAFSAAGSINAQDTTSVQTLITTVISGMYVSLYATLLGIATNLWLKINLRFLGNQVDGN